jgi:hypothetical protein
MLSPLYITPEGYFKGDIMMAFLPPRGEGGDFWVSPEQRDSIIGSKQFQQ